MGSYYHAVVINPGKKEDPRRLCENELSAPRKLTQVGHPNLKGIGKHLKLFCEHDILGIFG